MTSQRSTQKVSREHKARVKKILMLNGTVVMLFSLVGFLFLDQVAEFLGDRDIAIIVLGTLIFCSIMEIGIAKILFRETDRR